MYQAGWIRITPEAVAGQFNPAVAPLWMHTYGTWRVSPMQPIVDLRERGPAFTPPIRRTFWS